MNMFSLSILNLSLNPNLAPSAAEAGITIEITIKGKSKNQTGGSSSPELSLS